MLQDLSTNAMNPTHRVGGVTINRGCRKDSVTAEQWAMDNRQWTGSAPTASGAIIIATHL